MDRETRAQLEAPFPNALRRSRRGSFGREISYIEVARVIERLNTAFEAQWSFEVVEHNVRDEEAIVLVKLSAAGVVKVAFGSSAITLSKDTGKPVSIGDDLKSAASDGLKKAASLLGVALDLCSDRMDYAEPERKPEPGNVRTLRPEKTPAVKPSPAAQSGSSTDGKLTIRQSTAIRKLGEQLGMTGPECLTWILKTKGVPLDRLSTRAASELISELQARLTGRPGRASAGGAA